MIGHAGRGGALQQWPAQALQVLFFQGRHGARGAVVVGRFEVPGCGGTPQRQTEGQHTTSDGQGGYVVIRWHGRMVRMASGRAPLAHNSSSGVVIHHKSTGNARIYCAAPQDRNAPPARRQWEDGSAMFRRRSLLPWWIQGPPGGGSIFFRPGKWGRPSLRASLQSWSRAGFSCACHPCRDHRCSRSSRSGIATCLRVEPCVPPCTFSGSPGRCRQGRISLPTRGEREVKPVRRMLQPTACIV